MHFKPFIKVHKCSRLTKITLLPIHPSQKSTLSLKEPDGQSELVLEWKKDSNPFFCFNDVHSQIVNCLLSLDLEKSLPTIGEVYCRHFL